MSKGININVYTEEHWMLRPPTNCCRGKCTTRVMPALGDY